MLLFTNYDQFINWKEGTCNFNNDDFTNLLEIANMFPKETPNNDDYDPAGGIIDHTTLIYEAYMSSMNEYLPLSVSRETRVTVQEFPQTADTQLTPLQRIKMLVGSL